MIITTLTVLFVLNMDPIWAIFDPIWSSMFPAFTEYIAETWPL